MTENSIDQSIDSDYLDAENLLLDKDITAYVEGFDDEVFWADIFRKFAPKLRMKFYPYSRDYKSGKQEVLKNINRTSKTVILCVDADFDYLLKNEPVYSYPYIFHTYTYSIENYKIFPYNLNIIVQKCSLTQQQDFCFIKFFEEYSKAIYRFFLYIIYFEKQKYQSYQQREQAETEIKEKDLKYILCLDQKDKNFGLADNGLSLINAVKKRFEDWENKIIEKYNNIDLTEIDQELIREFNIKPEDIYWYIKGHILYDSVAKIILCKLIKKYQQQVKQSYPNDLSNQQIENKKKEYKNYCQKLDWQTLLKDGHTACLIYLDLCPPMQKIEQKIKEYLEN